MKNENFKDEIFFAIMERITKRLWIMCMLLISLLIITNAAWLYYESQFSEITTTNESVNQDVDTGNGDGNIIVNGIGDVNNGKSTAEDQANNH